MGLAADLLRPLAGRIVTLAPLTAADEEPLLAAAGDPRIWTWMSIAAPGREAFARWMADALAAADAGQEAPFVVRSRAGEVLGSTRFLTLRPEHRSVEIGWSWLVPAAWGTGANAEAKLLLLEQAFERAGCLRVEFKTDARNRRSRAALAALPAAFEGVLRRHMLVRGGERRDSAYYSVIAEEWPEVRDALRRRVDRHAAALG